MLMALRIFVSRTTLTLKFPNRVMHFLLGSPTCATDLSLQRNSCKLEQILPPQPSPDPASLPVFYALVQGVHPKKND